MKAQELRIGNYYNHNREIKQVTPSTIEEVWNEQREWCKPIPLTEEWLLKLGFYENRTGNPSWQLDVNLDFCIWGRPGRGFNVYVNSDEIGNPILYVHQLQNLYFALTGCELGIK